MIFTRNFLHGLLTRRRAWLALLIITPIAAHAGPPFITDDPAPVDYQHMEFYTASQSTKTAGGWSGTAPHFEFNYGVIPEMQLHIIAPLAFSAPTSGPTEYGYGDTELGAKYRFVKGSETSPQIATFPLLEIPTGDANEGLGSGHLQIFLPIWAQQDFGKWTIYGGGGYGINPGGNNRNWVFTGVVAQYQILEPVALGGEIYNRTSTQVGVADDTAFNLGTTFDLSDHYHFLLSAGRSIRGPTKFQSYVAFQLTF
jgi:hypothetical protein